MMFKDVIKINLKDSNYFDFGNGLWKGKKPPFKKVIVIRNTNFTDSGKINLSNVAVLEVEEIQFLKKNLQWEDIIIERSGGGPKQPVGRVVFFDLNHGDYSFSNFTSRIRVINQSFDPKFIFYFLHNFYQEGMTEKFQAHTTGIRNLDFNKYKEAIYIPLLPLSEQHNITYLLSTVQKAIKQQDKIIRTTTELKKTLMQKLFTEGTRGEPQKETEIGLVPESWGVVEFEKLVTIKGGFAFKSKEKVPYSNTQLIRMGNLYQNSLDLSRSPIFYPDSFKNQYSDFVLKEGDLIMSLTGTMGKEDYGFTVKLPKTDKILLLNQRVAKFVVKTDDIIKDYLKYYLLSRIFLDKLYKTAKGTKQANLSSNEIKKLDVLVPNKVEQELIVRQLSILVTKIEFHQTKKQTLTDLFKTLLHELMTGQRRVHELEFDEMMKGI